MGTNSKVNTMTIISKMYCSSSQAVLVVRRRPHVISGGGFVVTDCSNDQKVLFRVDGCGILGTKEELLLRDGNGVALLLIRRKVCSSSLCQPQKKLIQPKIHIYIYMQALNLSLIKRTY